MDTQNYYRAQKKTLMRNHVKMMGLGKEMMVEWYGGEVGERMIERSIGEFERLIPEIPYVGGKENSLTDTLVQMTSLLALYRVMSEAGIGVEEIGSLVHAMAEKWVNQHPAVMRKLIGKFYMSKMWRERTRKKAAISQQREYPENFVFEVVEGGENGIEWGINYLECGVVKYFHRMGADEFTPYMCFIDYVMFPGMGIDLQREGTIAHGCTHCDFRFKR